MGVIKKILYRADVLGKPRHRNFFLDMEENIHIHYRDLRIELSRGEFEDIVGAFGRQSAELLAIIEEKQYQDGRLPNANQEDVRIWTESRLRHEVKYHPQRFSLEECGDGYHFHYRNYKLLIDPDDFRRIARLFATLDIDGPYASTHEEVRNLLEANEVDFVLAAGNVPGEVLSICVARYHMPKVRDIFNYIGFSAEDGEGSEKRYRGEHLLVLARPDSRRSALDYRRLRGRNSVLRLADHLSALGTGIDVEELNELKCQVLDFYFAVKAGKVTNVDTDPEAWLYSPPNRQVIFPYRAGAESGPTVAEPLYRAWANLINGIGLGFVKPGKNTFPKAVQDALRQKVDAALRREVAAYAAVDRIHLMGSALRGDMGRYHVPFIHGRLAKLGSDIDILVDINPAREGDLPAHWRLHLEKSSNHCAVYHVGRIPLAEPGGDWAQRFPSVDFIPHLVDAYVRLPSRGHDEEIDAFLRKFGARCVYDRASEGPVYRGDEEAYIAAALAEHYGFERPSVERVPASTENAVFRVHADADYILKLFKVSGNYARDRVAEHTAYEEHLVNELRARGVPTAGIIPARTSGQVVIDGHPALLFERIPGRVEQRPPYPVAAAAAALAEIHRTQIKTPLESGTAFSFDDACMIWLPAFEQQCVRTDLEPDIAAAMAALLPLARRCFPGENRARWFARSPLVHNHGDVTPKNFILGSGGEARFFDFNNAFHGPRMADVIDGAFQFSLAEKYIQLADFCRFDEFIAGYEVVSPLTPDEREDLADWMLLVGILLFAKEVRVVIERPDLKLRRQRALAIAGFLQERLRPA